MKNDDNQLRERVARVLGWELQANVSGQLCVIVRGEVWKRLDECLPLDWNTAGALLERVQAEALEWDVHIDIMVALPAVVRWRELGDPEHEQPLTVRNVILACLEALEAAKE